jgi:hypothetical protein
METDPHIARTVVGCRRRLVRADHRDALGRAVVAQTQHANGNTLVDLRKQAAGLYVVRVIDATGNSASVKVLKQ